MTQKPKRSIGLPIISGLLLVLVIGMVCVVALKPGGDSMGDPAASPDSSAYRAAETYQGVSMLYVESGSADVVLKPSEDGALRVHLPVDGAITVDFDQESGTLWIEREILPFRIPMFWWMAETLPIHIEVPYVESIGVETTSGGIDASALKTEYLHLSSTSGDIQVKDADVALDITASSTSGNIRMERFYAETAYISANSGIVRLEEAYCVDISVYTQSGNQIISTLMGSQLYCYAESGNVELTPAQPVLGWVRTSSGRVRFAAPEGPQTVLFSTDNGRANLHREDIDESPHGAYTDTIRYDIGGEGPQLEVYTGSGNLTID